MKKFVGHTDLCCCFRLIDTYFLEKSDRVSFKLLRQKALFNELSSDISIELGLSTLDIVSELGVDGELAWL